MSQTTDDLAMNWARERCREIAQSTKKRVILKWTYAIPPVGCDTWEFNAIGPTGHMWASYGDTPMEAIESFEDRWRKATTKPL